MSTYIKYVFKYLFQPDQLSATELETAAPSVAASGSAMSNLSSTLNAVSMSSSLSGARQRMKCLEVGKLLARETAAKLTAVPNVTSGASNYLGTSSASASHNTATTQPVQHLRSFADFEAALKQVGSGNSSSELDFSLASLPNGDDQAEISRSLGASNSQYKSLDLFECFNQLQLQDYYSGYDIFVGLRIASTLTLLFVVFILFVIYKTGCRDNATGRSQLTLSASYREKEREGGVLSERQAYIRRLNADEAYLARSASNRRAPLDQTRTLTQASETSQTITNYQADGGHLECGAYRDWPA